MPLLAELTDDSLIGRLHQADQGFILTVAAQIAAFLLLWTAKRWLASSSSVLPRLVAVSLLVCNATALATWQASALFHVRGTTPPDSPLRAAAQAAMQDGLQLIGISAAVLILLAWHWLKPAAAVKR
ncbi:MAG: hypothetical protein RL095_2729 [Verrucomicrobiota bacterium]|jgi:hypothetical protein